LSKASKVPVRPWDGWRTCRNRRGRRSSVDNGLGEKLDRGRRVRDRRHSLKGGHLRVVSRRILLDLLGIGSKRRHERFEAEADIALDVALMDEGKGFEILCVEDVRVRIDDRPVEQVGLGRDEIEGLGRCIITADQSECRDRARHERASA
jgi:hypothetical protein